MATSDDRLRSLVKVAQLYYEENLTQEAIADRLHVSRTKVVRMLDEARQRGIVQIRVVPPRRTSYELERCLERAFGLRQALVVETGAAQADEIRQAVAEEAAALLGEVLKSGTVLAISSGTTLAAVAEAMRPVRGSGITIVDALGAITEVETPRQYGRYQVGMRLAEAIQARYRPLAVPRALASPAIVAMVRSDPGIRGTLELALAADVLLVGIGALDPLSPTLAHLEPDVVADLRAADAVGEIAGRFFDRAGQPCHSRIEACQVGLELPELRAIPTRIGVTFGCEKVEAIQGALAGRYVNVLVTDERTAWPLLGRDGGDMAKGGDMAVV